MKMFEALWVAQTACRNCGTVHIVKPFSWLLLGLSFPALIILLGYILPLGFAANAVIIIISAIGGFLALPFFVRLKIRGQSPRSESNESKMY
jgi:hypothetical protein